MIKMQPALPNRQLRCQPALVGTGPGTKINDLHRAARPGRLDQIRAQLRKERGDRGGPGGVIGGNAGGEPVGVDKGCCGRSR